MVERRGGARKEEKKEKVKRKVKNPGASQLLGACSALLVVGRLWRGRRSKVESRRSKVVGRRLDGRRSAGAVVVGRTGRYFGRWAMAIGGRQSLVFRAYPWSTPWPYRRVIL